MLEFFLQFPTWISDGHSLTFLPLVHVASFGYSGPFELSKNEF